MVNMLQRCQSAPAPGSAPGIQKRSPKTFFTTNPRTAAMAPAGSVYGMRNQSLAYTSANSMNRSFARSVVLASMSPKLVLRSSNDHHRVFGIPENETGVGIMVRSEEHTSELQSRQYLV